MDRMTRIRMNERAYHEGVYERHKLFEKGSWLYKPLSTVENLLPHFKDKDNVRVLDLGCVVGRNSIPVDGGTKITGNTRYF
ncbi:hypothetical protein [Shouchella miscanthi]|uniref:Class I SAM-dependent methyltransferase n=1 Tax=Shouchella miscanthi TaxID=2598861 RepID=A0ABU6NLU7_9BACI|nr:hypothetical protein [Shouchella miscanthi]